MLKSNRTDARMITVGAHSRDWIDHPIAAVRYSVAVLLRVIGPTNFSVPVTGVLSPGRCLLVLWPYAGVAQHRIDPRGGSGCILSVRMDGMQSTGLNRRASPMRPVTIVRLILQRADRSSGRLCGAYTGAIESTSNLYHQRSLSVFDRLSVHYASSRSAAPCVSPYRCVPFLVYESA